MAKKLSEHLAELSVRAKKAEDAVAAAQTEAHDALLGAEQGKIQGNRRLQSRKYRSEVRVAQH